MKAEILSVGTELLLGDIVNTNAQYLAQRLAQLGIGVYHQSVVGDNPERLKTALKQAFERCDLVITTGGLGPTKDDLTKEIAAEYFNQTLVLHQPSLTELEAVFKRHNWVMSESNLKQVYFPPEAIILKNDCGTAPGCIIKGDGRTAVLMPGPPREMRAMFEKAVVPYLAQFQEGVIVSKVLRFFGIGESALAEKLADIMDSQTNPTVAPYAKEIEVTLRISARAQDQATGEKMIQPVEEQIRARVGAYIYGTADMTMEEVVARQLIQKNLTIAVAESCTGGLIAASLINYPGISTVFLEGAVTYSNEAKIRRLGVKPETLTAYGAVSEQTAAEMARGIAVGANALVGLATTGLAGPDGGTPDKPVGLVYIGLYLNGTVQVKKFNFGGDRNRIRRYTALTALDWLRQELARV